ncbi:unnamed protein product [Ambrosiozyma monospora]|uniref:Unnamed protein product n=1 Tax=Ambrosiozyma monospora TaxID=43982 RepID=A0ACB5TP51_AMBMO|nr:unnamed protein product [Ambrosiozyma monospora]
MEKESYLCMLRVNKSDAAREMIWRSHNPQAWMKWKTGVITGAGDKSNEKEKDDSDDDDNAADAPVDSDGDVEMDMQDTQAVLPTSTAKIQSTAASTGVATTTQTQVSTAKIPMTASEPAPTLPIQSASETRKVPAVTQSADSETQKISTANPSTALIAEEEEDDDDDDDIENHKSTTHTSKTFNKLFLDSDDSDDEPEQQQSQQSQLNEANESTVDVSHIEDYKNMSRSEKILARVREKERLRAEKEKKDNERRNKPLEDEGSVSVSGSDSEVEAKSKKPRRKSKKAQEAERIANGVRQNEMIKKGSRFARTDNPDKFALSKFLENFNNSSSSSDDEDDKVFSSPRKGNTPHSSPSKSTHHSKVKQEPTTAKKPLPVFKSLATSKYTEKLQDEAKNNMIVLDSDESDDDIVVLKTISNKKQVFDWKQKIASKHKNQAN